MNRTAPSRRGFTLMEIIVVIVIILILSAMIMPRLIGGRGREFDHVVDKCEDLMTMYAQRSTMGQKPVGLQYDETHHQLKLMTLDKDPEDPVSLAEWRRDPSVQPVQLPAWIMQPLLRTDTEDVPYMRRPYHHEPGKPRRHLEMLIDSDDRTWSALLILPPHAIGPRRQGEDEVSAERQPVDLDSMGRTREDW